MGMRRDKANGMMRKYGLRKGEGGEREREKEGGRGRTKPKGDASFSGCNSVKSLNTYAKRDRRVQRL